MKTYLLKSVLVCGLMGVVGCSLGGIPPTPPPHDVSFNVNNHTSLPFSVKGEWSTYDDTVWQQLNPQGTVTFTHTNNSNRFTVTVYDASGNTCSAYVSPAWAPNGFVVTSNPSASTGWVCVANGGVLQVEPLST